MARPVPLNFRLAVAFGIAIGLLVGLLLLLGVILSTDFCWACG